MSFIRRPSYYKAFQCIGSACSDNCCIGWEIDVDEETLETYRKQPGTFGRRLRSCIQEEPEGQAHFILDEKERCPFLNEKNLCQVILELGEEGLCQICTDHPRFYDWFPDGKEEGLGLCCEAAAQLILQKPEGGEWELLENAEKAPEEVFPEEEQILFAVREQLIALCEGTPELAMDKVNVYGRQLAGFHDGISWAGQFWQNSFLKEVLGLYLSLEINDPAWRDMLERMMAERKVILENRARFLAAERPRLYEYNRLMVYFLYRHTMKARFDGDLYGKVFFAILSVCLIQAMGILEWSRTGGLSHWRQIQLCKLYSKEIEYNEENTEELYQAWQTLQAAR